MSMLGTSSSSQLWTARVTCQGGMASAILAIALLSVVVVVLVIRGGEVVDACSVWRL